MFNNFSFENRAINEIRWKNTVESDRPQMRIWRMRIACLISKATNTHSGYVVRIIFQLQRWLHERASMLRYTCIVSFLCEIISYVGAEKLQDL